jgi:hypothetical protein
VVRIHRRPRGQESGLAYRYRLRPGIAQSRAVPLLHVSLAKRYKEAGCGPAIGGSTPSGHPGVWRINCRFKSRLWSNKPGRHTQAHCASRASLTCTAKARLASECSGRILVTMRNSGGRYLPYRRRERICTSSRLSYTIASQAYR